MSSITVTLIRTDATTSRQAWRQAQLLNQLQQVIGGMVTAVPLCSEVTMWCHDEGHLVQLPANPVAHAITTALGAPFRSWARSCSLALPAQMVTPRDCRQRGPCGSSWPPRCPADDDGAAHRAHRRRHAHPVGSRRSIGSEPSRSPSTTPTIPTAMTTNDSGSLWASGRPRRR